LAAAIESGAEGTASITGSGGSGLDLSAGAFDNAGTLNAGTSSKPSKLTISGNFVEDPSGILNVYAGSTLTFQTGGNGNAEADLKGQLNLLATGATVTSAQALWLDGGNLTDPASGATTINGNLSVSNNGTMTVGSGTALGNLSMATGSLTIGSQAPGLSNTGGTLNLDTGATLSFPAATGVHSTFQVDGGPAPAVLNMYGASIVINTTRLPFLEVAGGTLNSYSSSTFADNISGNLSIDSGGTLNLGDATAGSTLDLSGGSFTVGAQTPGQSSSAATVNLNAGSTLDFTGTGSSTFVVQGGSAALNMYGAGITVTNTSLDLAGGVLNTFALDTITGSLLNAGTVQFEGSMDTLTVTGDYTQTSAGDLAMRLGNGTGGGFAPSDVLAITGNASLDGTLAVTAFGGSLNAGQKWEPVTYANNVGGSNFATWTHPPGGAWSEAALATDVQIKMN
jgi:hypothetical protein